MTMKKETSVALIEKYVDALELADAPLSLAPFDGGVLPAQEDDTKAGFVDAGSLVSFVSGVKGVQKQDTLNSTLLAQLAASKKFDREENTREWYRFYVDVLSNIGWVVQDFSFDRYQASGATVRIDDVILKVLAAIVTQNQIAIIKETMEALKALSEKDKGLVIFDSNSYPAKKGCFQIAPCAQTADGDVTMGLGAFYFSATKHVTKFLWFGFSTTSTEIYKGAQVATLNDQTYSRVREKIIDKLGDRAYRFVDELDI